MDKLQIIMEWMESFEWWGDARWGVDLNGCAPVSCRLTMEEDRVVGQKEDVLGGAVLSMRAQFSLIRVSYDEEAAGAWIEEFGNWVLCQSMDGVAPELGDGLTHYHLEKGKLEQSGSKSVYTVKLIGAYEKIF